MHARGGRTLARAGAWRGMFHVKHSSGDARTHAGRRPGRGQHADCRRRSLVRAGGGCADAGSLHVIGSPSRPRGRALGGSGSCAARGARRGLRGQAPAQGMRARGRCLRGRRSRARGGLPGRRLGQRALAQGDARAGVGVCACGQSEARRVGRPSRADSPRIDSRTARPPPRRPPPCVFNAPLLPKTRLRALFGRQFRILDHSSRSQRAFSPKASVSFRRAVIAVRGLDFGRSGRAVSHEAFVGALRGRPAPSAPCARCLSPRRRYNRHP